MKMAADNVLWAVPVWREYAGDFSHSAGEIEFFETLFGGGMCIIKMILGR
jgi:hypothetical protein